MGTKNRAKSKLFSVTYTSINEYTTTSEKQSKSSHVKPLPNCIIKWGPRRKTIEKETGRFKVSNKIYYYGGP